MTCAVWGGHTEVLRVLLQMNKITKNFIDVRDSDGDTALHRAASTGNLSMCSLLLEYGCNCYIKNKFGRTALHEASKNGYVTVCEQLIKAGCPINEPDQNGDTALHDASNYAQSKICHLLLQQSANCHACNKDGNTPLHRAAKSGDTGVVRKLLEAGSDCKLINKTGNTPLHLAASGSNDIVCRMLVDRDASCLLILNKAEETPLDLCPSFFGLEDLKIYMQKETQKTRYNMLKANGERPVKTVKLFLCGDPCAGKTTLYKTLSKGLLESAVRPKTKSTGHVRTPGIHVKEKCIRGAGTFVIWDMAGQIEYHVTHAMMLGSSRGLFILVYNASEPDGEQTRKLRYWLSFIKAEQNPSDESKNLIVIVGTHLDLLQNDNQKSVARTTAQRILDELVEMYGDSLDIHKEATLVDARDSGSENITSFKETLKQLSEPLRDVQVPSICDDITKFLPAWSDSGCPILYWPDFVRKVRTHVSDMASESLIRFAVAHLHDTGELHHAKVENKDDLIILDPNWLTSTIFGPIFARPNFRQDYLGLGEKQLYQLHDLKARFAIQDPDLLVTLLEYFELAYRNDVDTFIIPMKLPPGLSTIEWTPDESYTFYYGLRIECRDQTDMFTDDVFPCLQVQAMKRYHVQDGIQPKLSKSALKVFDEVEGMVQLTDNRRAIHIGVRMTASKKHPGIKQLNELKEMVLQQIGNRSRGTKFNVCYLSPIDMKKCSDLETGVQFYRKKAVDEALKKRETLLVHPLKLVSESLESVTGIVQQASGPLSVDDVSLRDLSKKIGTEWESLATYLGMDSAIIQRLTADFPETNDRIFNMFIRWRKMQPQSVNKIDVLASALEKVERVDLVQGTKVSYLSDVKLRDLTHNLGSSWLPLATYLEFTREDISKLQSQHTFVEDAIFNMLVTWRQRQSADKDALITLTNGLRRVGKNDLAQALFESQTSGHPLLSRTSSASAESTLERPREQRVERAVSMVACIELEDEAFSS
ncbi:death-associated protein kinase 1-like isoform X2 [Amphiura filiformis]